MGISFANIHVRTGNLDAVRKAVEKLPRGESLIACRNGWTAVYCERSQHGDPRAIGDYARSLSKRLQAAAIAILVHDSDVFRYQLFDAGRPVDQFDSRPDDFQRQTAAVRRRWAGKASHIAPYAVPGATEAQIEAVLTASTVFEEDRVREFAGLLGIDPALACAGYQDALAGGSDFVRVSGKGVSAADRRLKEAVRSSDLEGVRVALGAGASPDVTDTFEPILWNAIERDRSDIVALLLSAGAKVCAKTVVGVSHAMWAAACRGREQIVRLLLKATVPPTAEALADGLVGAAQVGSLAIATLLLEAGADVDAKTSRAGPPLWWAARHGHELTYQMVIGSLPATAGQTPKEWDGLLRLLLASGAEVDARNAGGSTALMAAAMVGDLPFVERLLEAGADPAARDRSGLTALDHAKMTGQAQVVRRLAAVTPVAKEPSDAELAVAAAAGDLESVERLLAAGVRPDGARGTPMPPLLLAAAKHHPAIVRRLLQEGADPNTHHAASGMSPLLFAIDTGDVMLVELLVELGVRFDERRCSGLTALDFAVMRRKTSIVRVLLNAGARVSGGQDEQQGTLWLARRFGTPEIVEALATGRFAPQPPSG